MLENCEIIVERDVNIDGCDKVAVFSDLVTANQLYKIIIINYLKKKKKTRFTMWLDWAYLIFDLHSIFCDMIAI